MSLSILNIADLSIAAMVRAEDAKMTAYSGFTLLALATTSWAKPGETVTEKQLRAQLSARVANLTIGGVRIIAENTWQSYVAGIFRSAAKFSENLATDPAFLSIRDMDDDDAIMAIQNLYASMGVTSGSDIRDFAKAEGFEFFDKDALKAAAKAAAAAKAKAKADAEGASFWARTTTDSATIVNMATPAPVDAVGALVEAIGGIGSHADALRLLDALNGKLAELRALAATPLEETVAPVMADDAAHAAGSAQAKLAAHFNKAA